MMIPKHEDSVAEVETLDEWKGKVADLNSIVNDVKLKYQLQKINECDFEKIQKDFSSVQVAVFPFSFFLLRLLFA